MTAPSHLTIATRYSRLALWQAETIATALRHHHPDCTVSLLPLSTRGDQVLDRSLAALGGKGLFIKELELALERGQADLAVHSAKDVPLQVGPPWTLLPVMPRACVADALVLPLHGEAANPLSEKEGLAYLQQLPSGSVIGTSSVRRHSVIKAKWPQLRTQLLRGNLDTRLRKLDQSGEYQAIILAAAGLQRLGYDNRINTLLPFDPFLPAIGQGALMVETLASRKDVIARLQPLIDSHNRLTVELERALGRALVSERIGCQMPLAAHAHIANHHIHFQAQVLARSGQRLYASATGNTTDSTALQAIVLQQLQQQGVEAVLQDWEEQAL